MNYLTTEIKQAIRNEIDLLTEGIFVHKRIVGQKLIPMHSHANSAQFIYVEGKSCRIHCEIDGEIKTFFVPCRHFAWIPPKVVHSVEANHPDFIMRSIYYTSYTQNEFYNRVGIYGANDLLIDLLDYTQEWDGTVKPCDEKRYGILKTIQLILPDASESGLLFSLPIAKDVRLQEIQSYIFDQLTENIDILKISKHFGFTPRTLLRLFQSDLKMSFAQYLKILRSLHAIELLTITELSLLEIACQVGYGSYPTFSNTFFEVVGSRPREFRKYRENKCVPI